MRKHMTFAGVILFAVCPLFAQQPAPSPAGDTSALEQRI